MKMISERISRAGAPVIGFGDADISVGNPLIKDPFIGFVAGAVGGAMLGSLAEKKVWTAVGTAVGAFSGLIVGFEIAVRRELAENVKQVSPWKRISDFSGLKSGQQIAMAITGPYGAPIPPELVSQFDAQLTALLTAPVNLPTANFAKYPPGSQLPSDWPKDDDLGAGAYRVTADVVAAPPTEAASFKLPPPSVGNMEIWTRTK